MNWFDWEKADTPFTGFVRGVIEVRQTRPLLTSDRFLHDSDGNPGGRFVSWLRFDGEPMTPGDWEDPERRRLTLLMQGDADHALWLALNAGAEEVTYTLPPGDWHRLVDTAEGFAAAKVDGNPLSGQLNLAGRSLVLLEATLPGPIRDEGTGETPDPDDAGQAPGDRTE